MGVESDSQPLTTYSQSQAQIQKPMRPISPITMQPPSQTGLVTPNQMAPHLLLLGPENTTTVCPFCYSSIRTSVKHTTSSRTHMTAALCAHFCCCCLPYCCSSAKNTDHYCPNCQKYLGTYEK